MMDLVSSRNLMSVNVRSSDRRRLRTKLFQFNCEVCMLDFIGAEQYLITDFGAVWDRGSIYTNTFGIRTRNCFPTVRKDPEFPYPWVKLKSSSGIDWFPINQLLGWAFKPNCDPRMKYFLSDNVTLPLNLNDFYWTDKIECSEDSLYKQFIDIVNEGEKNE